MKMSDNREKRTCFFTVRTTEKDHDTLEFICANRSRKDGRNYSFSDFVTETIREHNKGFSSVETLIVQLENAKAEKAENYRRRQFNESLANSEDKRLTARITELDGAITRAKEEEIRRKEAEERMEAQKVAEIAQEAALTAARLEWHNLHSENAEAWELVHKRAWWAIPGFSKLSELDSLKARIGLFRQVVTDASILEKLKGG